MEENSLRKTIGSRLDQDWIKIGSRSNLIENENGIILIYDWDFFRYWHKKTEALPGKVPEKPSFLETYFYLSTLNFF
ncbi:hypothetical protein [Peribacillus simplex]|uniref:hypothetical protein n=1 Tax=Peribacillus simplex TaxID=1478 RepID=UPI003D28C662